VGTIEHKEHAMTETNPDELLDTKQAAQVLTLKSQTLDLWRTTKRVAIPYLKLGRSVRYRRGDLTAYLERSVVTD